MWPLVEIVIEPKTKADHERLGEALRQLVADDPAFHVTIDGESGQTTLKGASELQLDIKLDILKRTYRIETNVGVPQVAYRETIGRRAEIDYTHKKQTGGTGEFARIRLVFEPGEPGSGYLFRSGIVGGSVPEQFIPGVERGLELARERGLLAGFPVIDFTATLVDGAYHDIDSSALTFEVAGRAAFRVLRERGAPALLEPIMRVEIAVPEENWRRVVGWLEGRQADVLSTETIGERTTIVAIAPLARTFGLWRMLTGAGVRFDEFKVDLDHYAAVPTWDDDGPDSFPSAAALRA